MLPVHRKLFFFKKMKKKNRQNAERQALRGTLQVVKGIHTKSSCQKLIGQAFKPEPSVLMRLADRNFENKFEEMIIVLLIAYRSGDLKHDSLNRWIFRKKKVIIPFNSTVLVENSENVLRKLRSQFTESEWKEFREPITERRG